MILDEEKHEKIKKALRFYADPGRYGRWSIDPKTNHIVFDPLTWGTAKYHSKPPIEAKDKPWIVADEALQELESIEEERNEDT
jgi:hypothetical protein